MKSILRALALTGIVAVAAVAGTQAANAQVGFGVRVGPAPAYYNGYVPPCPGEGYIWAPAYYTGHAWYPGRWERHDREVYVRRDFRYHDYRFDRRGWDHGRR